MNYYISKAAKPNQLNQRQSRAGVNSQQGKPRFKTLDEKLSDTSGLKIPLNFSEIQRLTMNKDIQNLMSEGQFTIRVEIGPAGTLAYLADKTSGQFVGSITDLNKIYAYKNLLSKEEKHNMISNLNDREAILFKRVNENLLTRNVTKAIEISDSNRAKMKSLVEKISALRANTKLLLDKKPATAEESSLKNYLIRKAIEILKILKDEMAELAKNTPSSKSRIRNAVLLERLIPYWVYSKLCNIVIPKDLISFRSLLFPQNLLKSVSISFEESETPYFLRENAIIIQDSEFMLKSINQAVHDDLLISEIRNEFDRNNDRIILLPPKSYLDDFISSASKKNFKIPQVPMPATITTSNNVVVVMNMFFLKVMLYGIDLHLNPQKLKLLFNKPESYVPEFSGGKPLLLQLAEDFNSEPLPGVPKKMNPLLLVYGGKTAYDADIAETLLKYFGFDPKSYSGKQFLKSVPTSNCLEGYHINSEEISETNIEADTFHDIDKILDKNYSKLEINYLNEHMVKTKPFYRRRRRNNLTTTTKYSHDVIEKISVSNPELADVIKDYLSGFIYEPIQNAIAKRIEILYSLQQEDELSRQANRT